MLQIMDISKKLENLSKPNETLQLKDLVGKPDALIIDARRVNTRYGRDAIVVDIISNIQRGSVFLPSRFTTALDDHDLRLLVEEKYRMKVEQDGGSSPIVKIFKSI